MTLLIHTYKWLSSTQLHTYIYGGVSLLYNCVIIDNVQYSTICNFAYIELKKSMKSLTLSRLQILNKVRVRCYQKVPLNDYQGSRVIQKSNIHRAIKMCKWFIWIVWNRNHDSCSNNISLPFKIESSRKHYRIVLAAKYSIPG